MTAHPQPTAHATATMQALVLESFALGATLQQVPVPEPAPGQVRIRVHAAALSPLDARVGEGTLDAPVAYDFPVVLGRDAAGVVDRLGAGVSGLAVGEKVIVHVPLGRTLSHGTVAEYAICPSATVTPKPRGLGFAEAAALPSCGAAALAVTEAAAPRPGDWMLVVGGGKGVAVYVVQLLAARGAVVLVTGPPEQLEPLTQLGALAVDPARARPTAPLEALIDLRTGEDRGRPLPHGLAARARRAVRGQPVTPSPGAVAALARDLARGAIVTQPLQVVSLEHAQDALASLAHGASPMTPVITIG